MGAGSAGGAGRRRARKLAVVTAVLVVVSSAGAGIAVLLWPDGTARVGVDDLVVSAVPLAGAGTQFVLPVAAALEQLPDGAGGGCSPADLDWLRGAGRERPGAFAVSLRNAGSGEGLLNVADVRAEGLRTVVADPVLVVDCAAGGGATDSRVEVDTDGAAAGVRRAADGATQPFSVGLVPGESDDLAVVLGGQLEFRGTFSARVSDGRRSRVVALPVGDAAEFERPGSGPSTSLSVSLADGADGDVRFRCAEGGQAEPCSAAGARARVARLWARPAVAAEALTAEVGRVGCADAGRLGAELDQVWRGYFGKEPGGGDAAYDQVVLRPAQGLVTACGRDVALAALDRTAMAAAGNADELRSALAAPAAVAEPEPTVDARPADCTEDSLRGATDDAGGRPLAERTEAGASLYEGFRVHACSLPYALVEASRPETGYTLYWLLEAVDERWSVRSPSAVGADTKPGRALFNCRDLAFDGMDTDAMRAAIGSAEGAVGRPLCP